jgi:pimeloyl-ACP methyl ester carboxylesterase
MRITVSRRSVLKTGWAFGTAVSGAGLVATVPAAAQSLGEPTDRFFRDDWFGEPWREPEAVVLLHGALESGIVWYAWIPTFAQHYRVVRPDLPGCGLSSVPAGFEWSFASLAAYVASVLDKAGVESAHIVGAKTGGPIAMQFAADFPQRTRSLAVVSGPASVISITNPSPVPQRDRLGSAASAQMIEYWNAMEQNAPAAGTRGLNAALSSFDLERDGVLQRIAAPSLIITSDQSALQSVEKVRKYQTAIRDSRLVVLRSDAYHIAVANPDECIANVLAFVRENA